MKITKTKIEKLLIIEPQVFGLTLASCFPPLIFQVGDRHCDFAVIAGIGDQAGRLKISGRVFYSHEVAVLESGSRNQCKQGVVVKVASWVSVDPDMQAVLIPGDWSIDE